MPFLLPALFRGLSIEDSDGKKLSEGRRGLAWIISSSPHPLLPQIAYFSQILNMAFIPVKAERSQREE